jgi:hypothetical protein
MSDCSRRAIVYCANGTVKFKNFRRGFLKKIYIFGAILICVGIIFFAYKFFLHKSEKLTNPSVLYVTTINAHNHAPHLNKYKVTNQNDVKELYKILINSKPFPKGRMSCPADFGIKYQLTFKSSKHSLNALAKPAGCGLTVINHFDKRMLYSEKFWTILAKDVNSTRLDMRGN